MTDTVRPLPVAVCPVCAKRVKVLKSGRLAAHLITGVPCHGPYVSEFYKIKEITLGVYYPETEMPSVTFTHEEVVVLRYILQNSRGGSWPLAWDGPLVKRVIEKIGPMGLNSPVEEL